MRDKLKMIRTIVEQYEKEKATLQQEKEKLKVESKAVSKSMTELFIKEANKDVSLIHANQKRIMEEIKKLKANTQEFIKQSHNWISLYDGLLNSLKEAGDVANWYNVLEKRANGIRERISEKHTVTVDNKKTEEVVKKSE